MVLVRGMEEAIADKVVSSMKSIIPDLRPSEG